MAGVKCFLLATVALAAALPSNGGPGKPMAVEATQEQGEPRETFTDGFSPSFSLNLPTQEFMGDFADSEAARQESSGFISNRPNTFPGFASLGGFGPMGALETDNVAGNFMQEINFPSVNIQDINEDQPLFSLPQFPQQHMQTSVAVSQSIASPAKEPEAKKTRTRRRAADPDPSDPANIPHKRVHRVQVQSQIPHSRSPRDFDEAPASQASHSENPLHFRSTAGFQFPNFQAGRREQPARGRTERFQSATRIPARFNPEFRTKAEQVHQSDVEYTPESQRFYPTFNGRHPPLPPPHQPFFPSPPLPPRSPGPRGGRFIPHSPGYNESPSHREQTSFKNFHNSFNGPGLREPFKKPAFSFPSSRRPFHREHEFENHDNSLLGSGNFEVLSGGTFYDADDPNGYYEYDHLLDGTFPGVHSRPHTNNYVDDFFSNFRDFSEFAARKSDEGESRLYLDDEEHYSRGYASEQVQQVAAESSLSSTSQVQDSSHEKSNYTQNSVVKNEDVKNNSTMASHKHRQPKNIQDVLAEVDPRQSEYSSSSVTVDEKDPMIAMF